MKRHILMIAVLLLIPTWGFAAKTTLTESTPVDAWTGTGNDDEVVEAGDVRVTAEANAAAQNLMNTELYNAIVTAVQFESGTLTLVTAGGNVTVTYDAGDMPITAISGVTGSTVQAVLSELWDDIQVNNDKVSYNSTASDKLATIEASADVTDAANVAAAGAVMNTGNETVAGIKTLTSSPIVPTPTTDMQASTKKYVDDSVGAAGGGDITGVTAGTGLTGGGDSGGVTITLADTAVSADEYTNPTLTVDAQGRITAAADGSAGSGSMTGAEIVAELVDEDVDLGTGGLTAASGTFDPVALPGVLFSDSGAPGTDKGIALIYANYIDGADGSENADLFFQAIQAGTLTTFFWFDESADVIPFLKNTTFQAGDIEAAELASTAVTPGEYSFATFTVDQQGRITAASSGSAGSETNSLETTITGIADAEIFVGDGADSGAFVSVSGDMTMTNGGVMTRATTIPTAPASMEIFVLDDCTTATGMATGDLCFEY